MHDVSGGDGTAVCAAGRKRLTLCEHILPQQNCTPCYTTGQNTRLALPAPACQILQTRQQPLRSKGPPSPVAVPGRRAAPAKPLLFVVVTIQYADLCWGTKLIWWSSPSRRFSTKRHKTVQASSLLRKSLHSRRKWHQFCNKTNPSRKFSWGICWNEMNRLTVALKR